MQALAVASDHHKGCLRKVRKVPTIIHPCSVALIVAMHKREPDLICAALLHDTTESDYPPKKLEEKFGKQVVHLIAGVSVTEFPQNGHSAQESWIERKQFYLQKMDMAEFDHMLIAAADKTDNLGSIIEDYADFGDSMWECFTASPQMMLKYYKDVVTTLQKNFNHPLLDQLSQLVELAEPIMN